MTPIVLGQGLLGKEIVKQTGWEFISREINNYDLMTEKPFGIFKHLVKYDTIINCIAFTETYSNDKNSNWNLNCQFVDKVVDFCNFNQKKLIHISTDYIYTNSTSLATEEDVPVHLNTWYGYTKLVGDALVQLRCKDFLICRLSHKPKPFPYDKAWTDIKTNGDYVDKISELVISLIKKNETGVFNVGTEVKSIYELAIKTKKVDTILNTNKVQYDTSMNLDKLNKVL